MNVLLSRSKFKVIIIGSLEFLRLRFIAGKDFDESDELYFLKAWLDYIDRKSSVNDEVPPVSIIPCSELGSGQL